MAINFSAASFAACLAGLKVPRQIMYCIAQGTSQKTLEPVNKRITDPNTPYVFYKDSMERSDWGNQATQTTPQEIAYAAQQQLQHQHIQQQHQELPQSQQTVQQQLPQPLVAAPIQSEGKA